MDRQDSIRAVQSGFKEDKDRADTGIINESKCLLAPFNYPHARGLYVNDYVATVAKVSHRVPQCTLQGPGLVHASYEAHKHTRRVFILSVAPLSDEKGSDKLLVFGSLGKRTLYIYTALL